MTQSHLAQSTSTLPFLDRGNRLIQSCDSTFEGLGEWTKLLASSMYNAAAQFWGDADYDNCVMAGKTAVEWTIRALDIMDRGNVDADHIEGLRRVLGRRYDLLGVVLPKVNDRSVSWTEKNAWRVVDH